MFNQEKIFKSIKKISLKNITVFDALDMEFSEGINIFIGPNGVGKSATIERLKNILETQGKSVYTTKEPTETNLGQFVRNYAESNVGIELACLVAADRYSHLINEILPQLQKGKIVITDRYFLSSLILQRMDNVDLDYAKEYQNMFN